MRQLPEKWRTQSGLIFSYTKSRVVLNKLFSLFNRQLWAESRFVLMKRWCHRLGDVEDEQARSMDDLARGWTNARVRFTVDANLRQSLS